MQRSECPECGAAVGGYAHTLESGNRRAVDIEEEFEGIEHSRWLRRGFSGSPMSNPGRSTTWHYLECRGGSQAPLVPAYRDPVAC